MILVDVNLLVYAYVKRFPQHPHAHQWLENQLTGSSPIGLPWAALLGFVRVVTNPRIFNAPDTISDSWNQVLDWLNCPSVWIPQPTARHAEILGTLSRSQKSAHGNLVPDAHLAALAIEHDLVLCSSDNDFARFPNLSWKNPLADK